MPKTKLKIQRWGNSLAVRIPAPVARSAHLTAGQPVELSVRDIGVVVKAIGTPKLSLAQKLAVFDPALHGGEAMPARRAGKEAI
ncbi:MAG: AbrB/MazE/SpoVT family DNA-binding domain-containing protein [Rhodospirillaceae bacterium]|nr:AbrB/MazE/SpoVT family DNA-binding domain-containing protein [Rhodospirillaceae bacterium]